MMLDVFILTPMSSRRVSVIIFLGGVGGVGRNFRFGPKRQLFVPAKVQRWIRTFVSGRESKQRDYLTAITNFSRPHMYNVNGAYFGYRRRFRYLINT